MSLQYANTLFPYSTSTSGAPRAHTSFKHMGRFGLSQTRCFTKRGRVSSYLQEMHLHIQLASPDAAHFNSPHASCRSVQDSRTCPYLSNRPLPTICRVESSSFLLLHDDCTMTRKKKETNSSLSFSTMFTWRKRFQAAENPLCYSSTRQLTPQKEKRIGPRVTWSKYPSSSERRIEAPPHTANIHPEKVCNTHALMRFRRVGYYIFFCSPTDLEKKCIHRCPPRSSTAARASPKTLTNKFPYNYFYIVLKSRKLPKCALNRSLQPVLRFRRECARRFW